MKQACNETLWNALQGGKQLRYIIKLSFINSNIEFDVAVMT